ncbi:hypothetical protein K788_0005978 [Paraburkholderia caribensis MBA4]|uniref:Uncharacterized protein n=1 Tax=Paraburkholderia caribensis MBA4 TaxID=1323664 RepID=A0A0P0R4F4_9BURK|nr:hypothetical protein K788_0005978 [Paraburkholderia caribensis MBA4]
MVRMVHAGSMNTEKGGVLRRSDAVKHRVSTVTAVSRSDFVQTFCPDASVAVSQFKERA